MPSILPFTPGIPFYRMSVTLGEEDYVFDVRWNERDNGWYFDLFTVNEVAIIHGVKVVLGTLLGGVNPDENRLPGGLIAADLEDTGLDPGFDDLGYRVQVYFYTLQEILDL